MKKSEGTIVCLRATNYNNKRLKEGDLDLDVSRGLRVKELLTKTLLTTEDGTSPAKVGLHMFIGSSNQKIIYLKCPAVDKHFKCKMNKEASAIYVC